MHSIFASVHHGAVVKRITVSLPEQDYERLRREAFELHVTLGALIRRRLQEEVPAEDDGLSGHDPAVTHTTAPEVALDAAALATADQSPLIPQSKKTYEPRFKK